MDPQYLLALTGGLTGGFGHCIGMCGPLAGSLSIGMDKTGDREGNRNPPLLTGLILYNTGRVTTYVILGFVMGVAGSFARLAAAMAGYQNAVLLVAGLVMILMGMDILGTFRLGNLIERHGGTVLGLASRLRRSAWFRPPLGLLPAGLVLGFLPCGLSYTFLIAAAGRGSGIEGGLIMLFFGLGTVPAMLLAGLAGHLLSVTSRGLIARTGGLVVILSGLYFIYLGLRFHARL
jgi:sulfite exporter TauE/SafE